MRHFNTNHNILVQITDAGWKHLRNTVGQDYINHCITPHKTTVEKEHTKLFSTYGDDWYKLQAHQVMDLLGTSHPQCISSNILIPE